METKNESKFEPRKTLYVSPENELTWREIRKELGVNAPSNLLNFSLNYFFKNEEFRKEVLLFVKDKIQKKYGISQ